MTPKHQSRNTKETDCMAAAPNDPKKPTQPAKPQAGGKPAPTGKPAPGAKPRDKPVDGKAADGKAADGKSAEAKKPAAAGGPKKPQPAAKPMPAREAAHGGGRRFGQVLIDLGFLDEDQLWDILEEAKNTSQLTGQVALGRGLITEERLLTALAAQHGLKLS